MIETIAVPLLVKAIEFLFDEGNNLLEERGGRTQKESTLLRIPNLKKITQFPSDIPSSFSPAALINTKQSAFEPRLVKLALKVWKRI